MPLERVSQGFKDISMSFQVNPLNLDLIALKNETAIARSVRNIVFTLPGEKFFDSNFGLAKVSQGGACPLFFLLFRLYYSNLIS